MATRELDHEIGEENLNAPDIDDDGQLDVETYPVPSGEDIEDEYLREVWSEAVASLEQQGEPDEDDEDDDDD